MLTTIVKPQSAAEPVIQVHGILLKKGEKHVKTYKYCNRKICVKGAPHSPVRGCLRGTKTSWNSLPADQPHKVTRKVPIKAQYPKGNLLQLK